MDVDTTKIERLSAGAGAVLRARPRALLRKNLDTGRLRFTTSTAEVAEFGDVHFLCVGTPQKQGETAGRPALHRRRSTSCCRC